MSNKLIARIDKLIAGTTTNEAYELLTQLRYDIIAKSV